MLESSKKLGYTEGIVSIIVNTLLFGIKIWVGLAASSVAMTADCQGRYKFSGFSRFQVSGF